MNQCLSLKRKSKTFSLERERENSNKIIKKQCASFFIFIVLVRFLFEVEQTTTSQKNYFKIKD